MAGFPEDLLEDATALLNLLQKQELMLATAESCTGGLIAAILTEIPGSSAVFDRSFVTYSNNAKTEMLGVPAALIEEFGAVSEPVGEAMAKGALKNSAAAVAVAVTGIAGPGGSDHKPEGLVCFAVATATEVQSCTVRFGPLGRSKVRLRSAQYALTMLHNIIAK